MGARIYQRRNGEFGASCDGVADTGHTIEQEHGRYTVWSLDDPDLVIAQSVPIREAEAAIAADWRVKPLPPSSNRAA